VVTEYRDDLPAISISRLRAMDVITAETTEYVVRLGHVEKNVSVHLRKFPSGGSWSWFGCPTCGKWVRTLRLHLDDIVCPSCCTRRGIRPRTSTLSVRQRAEHRIQKLSAKLESAESLRLKPHLWGKMERRSRLEAALRRAEYVAYRQEFTPLIEKDKFGK
jgi:DNA-directed RNA polymerase subunit RPC12/RpoP